MCCTGLLKIMMFIFNGIIFLAGVAFLAVGIWVQVDSGSLMSILGSINNVPTVLNQLTNIGYLLIAVGVILLVIGFLGCCGAVRESRCMLLTFFSIVMIIFIAEVVGAILLLAFEDLAAKLIEGLEAEVKGDIVQNYGQVDQVTELWNATMHQFKCCGFTNFTDFDDSPFVTTFGVYPVACCNATELVTSACSMSDAAGALVPGCFIKLVEVIEDNVLIVAGVGLGIAALEIAAMVVSMILYKDIGQKA